jgi:hypothetical protein
MRLLVDVGWSEVGGRQWLLGGSWKVVVGTGWLVGGGWYVVASGHWQEPGGSGGVTAAGKKWLLCCDWYAAAR